MTSLTDYLERHGIKYLVALISFFYIIGTVIFNIYLRSLGVFEFELIQLRYVFIGALFFLSIGVCAGLFLFIRSIFLKIKKIDITSEIRQAFRHKLEIGIFFFILPWMGVYALFIFPQIPSGFGGGKPFLARLIGEKTKIKNLNEIIARETGVPFEKLPFELLNENSELAVGANVKILDRNSTRYFLILTKDLYLRTTSDLAKNLLDSGTEINTEETKDFRQIPLLVKADKIETITLQLFEPPTILTSDDLKIAASVISNNPEQKDALVRTLAAKTNTNSTPQILEAVEKIEKISITDEEHAEKVDEILNNTFDNKFLDFRSLIFSESLRLYDIERFSGIDDTERFKLLKKISTTFERDFPDSWKNLAKENYLIDGQGDSDFLFKLSRIFSGAENADILIERINSTLASPKPTIPEDFETEDFTGSGFSGSGSSQ
jgi:hypothetical protein